MTNQLRIDIKKDLKTIIDPIKSDLAMIKDRLEHVENRLEHVEQDTFLLVNRSNPVHERLDTIEKVQLPKIRKSIRNLSKKFSDHAALPAHQSALKVS